MRGLQRLQVFQPAGTLGGIDGFLPVRKEAIQVVDLYPVSSLSHESAAGGEGEGASPDMLTVQFRGNDISVLKGTTLRTALLQNGLSAHNGQAVNMNCRGMGTCGTCAVKIEGRVVPDKWSARESLRLNFPPHSPPQNASLRLSCQVQVDGNLKVTKFNKFWGQGKEPVGPASVSDSVKPLGDVEFLLDFGRKR